MAEPARKDASLVRFLVTTLRDSGADMEFIITVVTGAVCAIFAGWFYTLYLIVKLWKGCA